MLKPAQLYKEELEAKIIESWYRPENIYWNSGVYDSVVELPDNNYDQHNFVSIDSNGIVIGYICYEVDWTALSASGFGAISFDKGNPIFGKDLYTAICNIFETYHLNRISWHCYADNPAIRGYRNFIKKHGGRECGYQRQVSRLQDGKLHDSVQFEIMADEWKK